MFNSNFNKETQKKNQTLMSTVCDLYANKGLTMFEISYKTKLSYYLVRKILIDNNIPIRNKNNRR